MRILGAIDLDALIPLIVGVFWVIAQIAGAAAKKKSPAPRSAPKAPGQQPVAPPAPSEIDGFAEMMRKLGGVQEFKIPEPPKPEPIPVADAFVRNEQRTPHQRPAPEPADVDIDIRPTMSAFKTAIPSMKLPAVDQNFQTLEKSSGKVPGIGNIINPADKQTLRRAILAQVILGKPKALENWNTGRID